MHGKGGGAGAVSSNARQARRGCHVAAWNAGMQSVCGKCQVRGSGVSARAGARTRLDCRWCEWSHLGLDALNVVGYD
eukprot:scaffold32778_cov146-Isochrysis_galbana.AAC.1